MLSLDGRWCLVYAIVGYLAGGILFCDLLLRGLKQVDVFRAADDGNPGTHNAFQLGGLWCGLGTLLGINVRDNVISAPRDFVEDNGLSYPSIYDPPFVNAVALGGIPASVIPTTIILDREHRPAVVFLKEVS